MTIIRGIFGGNRAIVCEMAPPFLRRATPGQALGTTGVDSATPVTGYASVTDGQGLKQLTLIPKKAAPSRAQPFAIKVMKRDQTITSEDSRDSVNLLLAGFCLGAICALLVAGFLTVFALFRTILALLVAVLALFGTILAGFLGTFGLITLAALLLDRSLSAYRECKHSRKS